MVLSLLQWDYFQSYVCVSSRCVHLCKSLFINLLVSKETKGKKSGQASITDFEGFGLKAKCSDSAKNEASSGAEQPKKKSGQCWCS